MSLYLSFKAAASAIACLPSGEVLPASKAMAWYSCICLFILRIFTGPSFISLLSWSNLSSKLSALFAACSVDFATPLVAFSKSPRFLTASPVSTFTFKVTCSAIINKFYIVQNYYCIFHLVFLLVPIQP